MPTSHILLVLSRLFSPCLLAQLLFYHVKYLYRNVRSGFIGIPGCSLFLQSPKHGRLARLGLVQLGLIRRLPVPAFSTRSCPPYQPLIRWTAHFMSKRNVARAQMEQIKQARSRSKQCARRRTIWTLPNLSHENR